MRSYGNPRGVISSIAIGGNVAYAVSGSCQAAAMDARRGTVFWKRSVCSIARNDDTYPSPVLAAGRGGISATAAVDSTRGHGDTLFVAGRGELWAYRLRE